MEKEKTQPPFTPLETAAPKGKVTSTPKNSGKAMDAKPLGKIFAPSTSLGRVVVGMSGGVDSSVAAYLLKKQGYDVIGLFMKNWEETNAATGACTAEADYNDVKRVCETLNIPYYAVNFSKQYMDNVFAAFLQGLKNGTTPNPDILCNREIKFGPFLDFADKMGADYIATGHYARTAPDPNQKVRLLKSIDDSKDQTYFLCGLSQRQLSRVLFPVGALKKTEVRKIAAELNLVTSDKKDSTGICFIGERNFRAFMKTYLGSQSGDIKTLSGETVGKHDGLMYYTIGQRKGLGIGGLRPTDRPAEKDAPPNDPHPKTAPQKDTSRWFVVKKDLKTNTLYVNNGECPEMFSLSLTAQTFNFITQPPTEKFTCTAKVRYRQPDQPCTAQLLPSGGVAVTFDTPQRAVTAGQWVVLYSGDVCLGGGEITEVK